MNTFHTARGFKVRAMPRRFGGVARFISWARLSSHEARASSSLIRVASFSLTLVSLLSFSLVHAGCGGAGADACDETCDTVYPRFADDVEALRDGRVACTEHDECEAVLPSMGCDDEKATWLSVCHQAVRGDEAAAFLDDVRARSDDYCRECMPECAKGPDCPTTFAAACKDGECVISVINPD